MIAIIVVLLLGYGAGQLARRLGLPALVGMILVGIALSEQLREVMPLAGGLRTIAVAAILMKAGLGLDYTKLKSQGTVALRLGFLPASCEAIVVAVVSMFLLGFDLPGGLLLGCILGAESPAVIVPGMLRLKSLGWGVDKGIPDAILTGSAVSDVLLLAGFNLLLGWLGQRDSANVWWLPVQVILQIGLGIGIGFAVAKILVWLLTVANFTQNLTQDMVITTSACLGLIVGEKFFPYYSGYLAVMALGFFLLVLDQPLARLLRTGFDSLWGVAEIFLFVLLGASLPIEVLGKSWGLGLLIIVTGTLIGRMLGWYLSTLGSNWNLREKLFLLPANSAKATVQAAIGAIPLAQGIGGGEEILAIASLSILVTAPLGAWLIPTTAPLLLTKGEVDPTKVAVTGQLRLLTAVDTSDLATDVLRKAADIARRTDAEVIVVYVLQADDPTGVAWLAGTIKQVLADIRYQFLTPTGVPAEAIVSLAEEYQVNMIVMGKRRHPNLTVASISQAVIEASSIPVTVVEMQQ